MSGSPPERSAQAGLAGPVDGEEAAPCGGGGLDDGAAARARRAASSVGSTAVRRLAMTRRAAGDEGEEELQGGDVEGDGGDGEEGVCGLEAGLVAAWRGGG